MHVNYHSSMQPLATLARIDLNLLTVFRAVDEARHVTRAARLLGVSQPALSQALRRMREAFGDPIFVKTPRGMVLTPLAESIAAPIREALGRIERDVLERGPFRAAELARTFRIRSTDFLESLLVPPLLEVLRTAASSVRLAFLPVGIALPKEELELGACDLAIAGFFGDLPDGYYQQLLFTDVFACAARANHPRIRATRKPTLNGFCRERHILVAPGGELSGAVDRALARQRCKRTVVVGASAFMSAGWLAARSDCIVTAPSRLIRLLAAPLRLVTFAPPVDLPEIKVAQVWHGRSHEDPAHRWFRELVRKCALAPRRGVQTTLGEGVGE
jgi:DNA-binding transcriptional LysR family regulator